MRALPLLAILSIAGCSAPRVNAPSLAPRAAEAVDPRLPVPDATPSGRASPALVARLEALIGQARRGDAAFVPVVEHAERLALAAGAPQTESWVVAQQALSAAVAAREPVTKALGDIDAIGSTQLAARGAVAPADQAALAVAAATVGEIDRRQADAIDRLQRQLGG